MKKCMLALFVSMVALCGISVAMEIPVTELAGQTSCNSNETENIKLYLTSNGAIRNPGDVFRNNVDSLIGGGNNGSSIDIWRHGVISSCNTWNRISNVVDGGDSNGALVFLNTDNCVFNIPNYTKISNPTAIDAQIHFTVGYRLIYSGGPNSMTDKFYYRDYGTNQWTCYPNGNQTLDYNSCSNTTVQYGSKKSHTGECINYRVFWCGDGLVNSPYGTSYDNGTYTEECDPQAPGWNEETCNPSTCKVNPQCNSLYNGSGYYTLFYTGSWLNSSMSTLCTSGAVTNFQPNPIPTNPTSPIQYSWSCTSGGVTTTGCNAIQMWCGDGVIQTGYGEQCEPGLPIPSIEKGSALDYLRDFLNQQGSSGGKGTSPSSMGMSATSGTRTNSGYSCNSLCQLVQNPQCSSTYSGTSYTFSYPGQLTSQTPGLCSGGTVTNFQTIPNPIPANPTSPIQYSWSCTTGGITITGCNTIQNWCGDGQVNGSEQCDPNDPNHIGRGDGCNASCQPTYNPPLCNSQYNGSGYYSGSYTGPWLNSSMTTLCANGTVTNFQTIPNPIPANPTSPIQYTWSCTTTGGAVTGCNATQNWCGDGVVSNGEVCDPNDSNHTGWGNGGCSNLCQPVTVNPQCNSQYNGQVIYTGDSTPYLNQWMTTLCTNGSVTDFQYSGTPIQYTWSCTTGGVTITGCNAVQQWCGDGQLQTNYGEQCDPNDPSHQGWGGGGCSNSCQPVTVNPQCNSQYNGQVIYTGDSTPYLNQWMTTLCTNGSVTDFQYSGTPIQYTWSCTTGGVTITGCNAVQQWCGDGQLQTNYGEQCDPNDPSHQGWGDGCSNTCQPTTTPPPPPTPGHLVIDKTLVGSGLISNTGDTVVWKIRVTAVSGDVTNFIIKDILPSILGHTDSYVLHNPGLSISNPITTQTTNGLEIRWDVIGTLTQGNYIEIQVNTYAMQMPNPQDTYKNVGCVTYDNTELCDPEPIPGHLEILKTLVGSGLISNTGDIVTWRIRVTAIGESFSGFDIIDRLPNILSYDSYTVIHNGGLTISNPVISGNEVIWTPSGVLSTGDYVEIELQTRANGMPEGGYVNVACVSGDWIGEICNSVHIGNIKIEKTLVGNRIITNTGDTITWNIVVTAVSGDVENPIITDLLPPILSYSGYSVIISGGLNVSSPIISGNEIIWNTQGVLTEGNQIVIRVVTSVEEMPDHDYDNVACVKYDENGEPIVCDDENVPAPKLRIKKTFIDGSTGKVVNVGDEIVYKITFGNSGDAAATITSIKDFLPNTVEYSASAIFISGAYTQEYMTGWSGIVHSGQSVQNIYLDIFTGITLNPGDSGYIILTGRVLSGTNQDNRTNFACIYLNDNNIDCDDVAHEYGSLMCMAPEIATSSFNNAGGSTTVVCKTYPLGSNAEIELNCGNGTILSGTNISELSGTCIYPSNSSSSSVSYTVKCTVNGTGDCQGTVTVDKPGSSGCFPVGTKVTMADGSKKNIEKVEAGDKVLSYNTDTNTNEFSIVKEKIVHTNHLHEMYELTINGEILKVTDVHPFYVRKSLTSNDYDWIETKNLKVGDILLMSDGNLAEIEKINHYNNQETVYNLEVQGNHNYFVDRGYLVHNKGGSSCFVAGTKVTMADGSNKNIEDVKIGEKVLGSNGAVNTVLGYDRPVLGNRHLWSINGSEYFVSDEHPFMTTDGWKSFNPEMTKLEVNLDTTELKVGDILITDNGLEEVKSVDYIDADYNTPLYNFALDGNHTYYANNYLVHNKCIGECCNGGCNPPTGTDYCQKHPNDPICKLANPRCHNVNAGNFSIESGEYLPFYFNVWRDSNETGYTYIFAEDGTGCASGTVDLGSLKCKYLIRSPDNNRVVYSRDNINCLEKEKRNSSHGLIKSWIEKQQEIYEIDLDDLGYEYWPRIEYTKSSEWDIDDILGEYKFQIIVYQYKQCNYKGEWETHTMDEPVCQSNFVLTEPYTVQKTPSGNLTASTETLDNFREVDGSSVGKPFSSYLNAISTSEYTPNSKVRDAMDAFIEKYAKLAVNVKKGDSTIKKVPGKNIYFLNGDFPVNNSSFDKPFTLVQLNPAGKIKIEGNVTNLNMMVLTKGDIEFKGNCESNQTVKGIFYAEGKLIRIGVNKNNNLNNNVWCTKGGLNIKGVLIGSNFNNLMKNSRSHLETWFNETPSKTTKVMNGASVLIEYSPSVFTTATMPPGAEDFTTALSIYKN